MEKSFFMEEDWLLTYVDISTFEYGHFSKMTVVWRAVEQYAIQS
jgi:hypothetical protein